MDVDDFPQGQIQQRRFEAMISIDIPVREAAPKLVMVDITILL